MNENWWMISSLSENMQCSSSVRGSNQHHTLSNRWSTNTAWISKTDSLSASGLGKGRGIYCFMIYRTNVSEWWDIQVQTITQYSINLVECRTGFNHRNEMDSVVSIKILYQDTDSSCKQLCYLTAITSLAHCLTRKP